MEHGNIELGRNQFELGHWRIDGIEKCDNDTSRYCGEPKFIANDANIANLVGATYRYDLELQTEFINHRGWTVIVGEPITLSRDNLM